ncbi:unnamed protein product [Linum trigynum]|uniref:Uncharacterized protein n=1 Tax=Linum trigynum TaxID=586398 RepID=A0AAV2EIP4_9ROSI
MSGGDVIGIDLGTTFSCVAVARDGKIEIIANDQGNRITPSFVAFTAAESERLIGEGAKNQAARNPRRTIFDAKRLIGKKFDDPEVQRDLKYLPYPVVNRDGKPCVEIEVQCDVEKVKRAFRAEEISAMILGKVKETAESYLGKPVAGAVVTVPAYFNDAQRKATKDAGTIAGLNVIRIINEPTAAALAYGLENRVEKNRKRMNALVYDLGGGTFDVSVMQIEDGRLFQVLATGGDTHLGGVDFDNRVVDYFVDLTRRKYGRDIRGNGKALGRLRRECERAKRVLSHQSREIVEIDSFVDGIDFVEPLTKAKFEELNLDLFRRTMEVVRTTLEDARLGTKEVDEVVLVGGSTRIPKLREMLKEMFHGKGPCKGVNPDEAVAYGAAVLGANLSGQANAVPGVALVDDFTTKDDRQTTADIKVYQGERPLTKDCIELGGFVMSGITPALRGVPKVDITFEIDEDGILKVTAREKLPTAESQSITITDYKGNLTQQEIERLVEEAKKMAEEDKMAKARVNARNELERYIYGIRNAICRIADEGSMEMVESAVGEASRWYEENQGASKVDHEKMLKKLEDVWNPIVNRLYHGA